MSILQDLAGGITAVIAPDLQNVETQAAAASQQLQLAFEAIIAEGAIIVALMVLQLYLIYRLESK